MQKRFLGLRTVQYQVPDIKAAKEWYSRVFETEPYFDEPFYVGFSIKGYELGLTPADEQIAHGEGVITYWGVESVQEEYDRIIAMGGSPYSEPQDVGGDIIVAAVKDPWDNIIGLIRNPGFRITG